MGAMQEVREQLERGVSSGAIIAKGYAPGTVYKVQRQFRRSQDRSDHSLPNPEPTATSTAPTAADIRIAALEFENGRLQDEVFFLLGDVEELMELRKQFERTREQLATALTARDDAVAHAALAEERCREAVAAATAAKKEARGWALRWESDLAAHAASDKRAGDAMQSIAALRQDAEQLRSQRDALQGQIDGFLPSVQRLYELYQHLEPLEVWAGHPCAVCKQPMSGVVERQLAAKVQEGLAHTACVEGRRNPGPGLGSPLASGATMSGLTRLR